MRADAQEFFYKFINNMGFLEGMVSGPLRSSIHDHNGPITNDLVGSAAKRIASDLRGHFLQTDLQKMLEETTKAQIAFLEKELLKQQKANRALAKSNRFLLDKLDGYDPNWRDATADETLYPEGKGNDHAEMS